MEKSTGGGVVGWKSLAVFTVSLILLAIGVLVIHHRLGSDGSGDEFEQKYGMVLKADPNPLPIDSEGATTTINWSAPGYEVVQIFVAAPWQTEEKLCVESGGRGSTEVDFVVPGRQYEFRMYAGKEKKELLAVLKIPKE